MRPRVAIVVQRYGEDILGGAESHARQVAERLALHYNVEVLTTCARDYTTWDNNYAPGSGEINKVSVRRFLVAHPRKADFAASSNRIFNKPHTEEDELAWVRDQGPYAPDLLAYLEQESESYDVFIFFTYLYYPTAVGLKLVRDKAILVPTAHDEWPIYFGLYRDVFLGPRAILYSTEEERHFVQSVFGNDFIPNAIAGVGVDLPRAPEPARFRQLLRLDQEPYFLYLGRITQAKGCNELIDFYNCYQESYEGEAKLVMVGQGEMLLPKQSGLVEAGFVDEQTKFDAIAGAEAIIVPSRYESMSMVALEGWMLGKPIVCTGQSEVVREMCQRNNGGLYYYNRFEFTEILHLLATDSCVNTTLGRQGKAFVESTYTWRKIIASYQEFIEWVTQNPWSHHAMLIEESPPKALDRASTLVTSDGVCLSETVPQPKVRSQWCKLCDLDDWAKEDFMSKLKEMNLGSGQEQYHRKRWEFAHMLRGLEALGYLRPEAEALAVGAGREYVLYYLANRIRKVVASDIYGEGEFQSLEAPAAMLDCPEKFAPFPYRESHLVVEYMSGCDLRYADDSFDFVYSLSSIEHFGGHEAATQAMKEMARVLRPGGVAVIATEAILNGVAHPEYFLPDELYTYLVDSVGLELIEPIDFRIAPSLLQTPVDLAKDSPETLPHIVCKLDGVLLTSVFLWLRKSATDKIS